MGSFLLLGGPSGYPSASLSNKVNFGNRQLKVTPLLVSSCCNLFSSSASCAEGHSAFCRMCYLFPTNPQRHWTAPIACKRPEQAFFRLYFYSTNLWYSFSSATVVITDISITITKPQISPRNTVDAIIIISSATMYFCFILQSQLEPLSPSQVPTLRWLYGCLLFKSSHRVTPLSPTKSPCNTSQPVISAQGSRATRKVIC